MADLLPLNFPTPVESAAINYNYEDFIDGSGIRIFYGFTTYDSGAGEEYIISPHPVTSHTRSTYRESAGTTTMVFKTSSFNSPRITKGTAIFSTGAGTDIGSETIKVQLHKYDGSTQTNISSELTSVTVGAEQKEITISIPLTETHFKIGDSLRMTVTLVAGGAHAEVGHSPDNLDGERGLLTPSTSSVPTAMKLYVPFKINQ